MSILSLRPRMCASAALLEWLIPLGISHYYEDLNVWYLFIVGIKSFLMLFGVTAALIDVNAAQSKLVLLENFNENYFKCLRLLYKVNTAEGVNAASEEVSTAELVSTAYVICIRYLGKRYV
ncbi:hypothetical protein Tco_1156419 [Tanacetum coccineum]